MVVARSELWHPDSEPQEALQAPVSLLHLPPQQPAVVLAVAVAGELQAGWDLSRKLVLLAVMSTQLSVPPAARGRRVRTV